MSNKKNRRYNMSYFSLMVIAAYILNKIGIDNIPMPIIIILAIGCIAMSLFGLFRLKTNIRIKIYGFLVILFIALYLAICILYTNTNILNISKSLFLVITLGLFCSVLLILIISIIDNNKKG